MILTSNESFRGSDVTEFVYFEDPERESCYFDCKLLNCMMTSILQVYVIKKCLVLMTNDLGVDLDQCHWIEWMKQIEAWRQLSWLSRCRERISCISRLLLLPSVFLKKFREFNSRKFISVLEVTFVYFSYRLLVTKVWLSHLYSNELQLSFKCFFF